MNILVPIKRVPDYHLKLQLNHDANGIDNSGVKYIINPFDAIALQQALDLKKQLPECHIKVISIGGKTIEESLRQALAMGADEALAIETTFTPDSLQVAKILRHISERDKPDLILMGKQSIDTDANQTPQLLATLLDWPMIPYISALNIDPANKSIQATCELDAGLTEATCSYPAVISCDLRLNTPKAPNMMGIMQAKQKPLTWQQATDFDISFKQHANIIELTKPSKRAHTQQLADINELISLINKVRTS